jgi:hypothetical protein
MEEYSRTYWGMFYTDGNVMCDESIRKYLYDGVVRASPWGSFGRESLKTQDTALSEDSPSTELTEMDTRALDDFLKTFARK